jgi:hypothetical protein
VPEVRGRVIDGANRPVCRAHVRIVKAPDWPGNDIQAELITDESGHFFRKSDTQWALYIFPMDVFTTRYEASVVDGGQVKYRVFFGSAEFRLLGIGKTHPSDLGDLVLRHPATAP